MSYFVVDIDDWPAGSIKGDLTSAQLEEMMKEFDKYYPGAVASLARAGEGDERK